MTLARAIVRLKFEPIKPLAEWFAAQLERVARANSDCLEAGVVVPCRFTGTGKRNAATTLGRSFSPVLWLGTCGPFRPVLLMRTRPRRPEDHLPHHKGRWEAFVALLP